MIQRAMSQCPDDETFAVWVEGRLSKAEAAVLIEHASVCEECIPMLDAANETFHAEAAGVQPVTAAGPQRWLLAAAAVLAVAVATGVVLRMQRHDLIQELVNVAPRSARAIEARLSGGFPWAPYRGSMRAGGTSLDIQQLKLTGVAGEALERAQRDPSPDAQRAAAAALVMLERPEEGITRLAAATKRSPSDIAAWNDLAAAQYAAALSGRTALFPEALASADRALRIDPRFREALFNRALILERLGIRGEARAAWERYLETDPSSEWAAEARDHLARLTAERDNPPFENDRQKLETAAASGDEPVVRAVVSRHAENARRFAEGEYLGRWADALQQNNVGDAKRWLVISRNIGAALKSLTGESLLHDAVQAIDTADASRQQRIAEAYITYRRGRVAYSSRELSAGEQDLHLAAEQFAAAGDPMSLAARSYAASARLAQNDVVQSRRELSELLPEVDAAHGYLSLAAQVRWELGRGLMLDDDWAGAARMFAEAESLFGHAGESVNEAWVEAMLADALIAAGRPDEAWTTHIRAFSTLTAAGEIERLDAAIGGVATTALRSGKMETARALVVISESLERKMSNDQLLADTLVRKSLLDAASDEAAAVRSASEAASVAMRIPSAAIRARHLADADLAMSAALLGSNARSAHEFASRSLDLHVANGMTALVPEPYLVRARASLRLGDIAAAERDLGAGIAAIEQHPTSLAGSVIGTGILDAGNALFEEAIRLDLDRGDVPSAFSHAEHLHGVAAGSGSLGELRARLAGSGTAVVTLIALPHEVVSLTVTERDASANRHSIARDDLAALAARDDDASLASLYDLLIRPAAPAFARARSLIVIPDRLLERVPFAALRDGNRMLIEQLPVAIASSAMSLQARSVVASAVVVTIGLPSGVASGSAPLPEVERELTEIGRLYRTVRRPGPADTSARIVEESAAGADVLHIAGHTEGEAATGDDALAIAGGGVSWRTVAAMHNMAPVVVLSACNTLRRSHDQDRRALSLAGAFVAAGARDVVGTLAPIGDADARTFFLALHEQLARGVSAPAALRNVQIAQLRRPDGAWRHIELLTTTIHRND